MAVRLAVDMNLFDGIAKASRSAERPFSVQDLCDETVSDPLLVGKLRCIGAFFFFFILACVNSHRAHNPVPSRHGSDQRNRLQLIYSDTTGRGLCVKLSSFSRGDPQVTRPWLGSFSAVLYSISIS